MIRTDRDRQVVLQAISGGRRYLNGSGIREVDLHLAACLFGDWREWSVSALSDATGLTRVTVRAHLRAWAKSGFIENVPGGCRLTPDGRRYIRGIIDGFLDTHRALLRTLSRVATAEPAAGPVDTPDHSED